MRCLIPGVGGGCCAGGGFAELSSRGLVGDQVAQGCRESWGVIGGDESGGALFGHLGEAAYCAEDQGLAEGEGGVEDAAVLDVAVGEGDDVGAAHDRGDLGVLHKPGEDADAARGFGGEAAQRLDVHARVADDPELGTLDLAECFEQGVDALVGAQQAEEEDHRSLGTLELGRQRLLLRQPRQVVEGAVVDDVHPARVEADLLAQPAGAVLGVGDRRRPSPRRRGELRPAADGSARAAGRSARSSAWDGAAAGGESRGRGR